MKTTLTLNTGTFYFMSSVNLVKGYPVEVDLTTLNPSELKNVKSYIDSGHITSSGDVSTFTTDEDLTQLQGRVEAIEKKQENTEDKVLEASKAKETSEDTEENESKGEEHTQPYTEMTKKELLAEIETRGLKTELKRNDDLIKVLEDHDKTKN